MCPIGLTLMRRPDASVKLDGRRLKHPVGISKQNGRRHHEDFSNKIRGTPLRNEETKHCLSRLFWCIILHQLNPVNLLLNDQGYFCDTHVKETVRFSNIKIYFK